MRRQKGSLRTRPRGSFPRRTRHNGAYGAPAEPLDGVRSAAERLCGYPASLSDLVPAQPLEEDPFQRGGKRLVGLCRPPSDSVRTPRTTGSELAVPPSGGLRLKPARQRVGPKVLTAAVVDGTMRVC